MGLHVSAENGVNARLVPLLLPEPVKKIGVKSHRDHRLALGQYHCGVFPKRGIRGMRVRIGLDPGAYPCRAYAAQLVPVGAGAAFRLELFSSRCVFHGVLLATLR